MKTISTVNRRHFHQTAALTVSALICLLLALVSNATVDAAATQTSPLTVPPVEKILDTLRRDHPRVMADATTFDALRDTVDRGGLPAGIYRKIKQSADQTLSEPVSEYEKRDGRRLLSVSRRVLDRVRELALVSRLERDPRYADRAWKELEAAAGFPDWNPAHFLDTAEMTHAFALGYDWLYDHWTDDQRRVLRTAIVDKGLLEGLKVYAGKKGWARNENNWNQVCNGGLIAGALAIADAEPQLAARIVSEAVQSVPLAMQHYAPDGAGTEGVTYWGYGSHYNIVLLASLQSALGTDFGLAQVGAFGQSGYYQIYMSHRHKNPRHAYYRVRAEGHNVPVLNPDQGPDQNPKAIAKIVQFEATPRQAVAVVDLGQAYQPHAVRALRTFTLQERKRLVVSDELTTHQPAELWWFLHTEARIQLSDQGRTATLSQHGKTFTVRLEEPQAAAFTIMECRPLQSSPNPEPQANNRGRSKLALHWPKVQSVRIQVSLEP